MELVLASNNAHKLKEIREALGSEYQVTSLKDKGIEEEIPETHDTLEGNAIEKAQYIYDKYGLSCFADDTGVEVAALDNRPGVYSARYAGLNCSFADNVNKLLGEMQGKSNRAACFRTVIALVHKGEVFTFEGKVEGWITETAQGAEGFGYDPVFRPENYKQTFAEMPLEEKNKISHRARAVRNFVEFIRNFTW